MITEERRRFILTLILTVLLLFLLGLGAFLIFKNKTLDSQNLAVQQTANQPTMEEYHAFDGVTQADYTVSEQVIPIGENYANLSSASTYSFKGYVKSVTDSSITLSIIGRLVEINIVGTQLRCFPFTMKDSSEKEVPMSQVYIDLSDTSKINSTKVSKQKILDTFGLGSIVQVRATRQGQQFNSELWVGFGCSVD